MMKAEDPCNEDDRLISLKEYGILDSLPEKEYDDITYLASQICNTPMSLVSLIDKDRQWFKSHFGITTTETPREIAFCAHAILEPYQPFIIPDSNNDNRFKDNPLVIGYPHITFYAGVSLVNADGQALGVLCVMDDHPRQLTKEQIVALKILGEQVVRLMDLRKKNIKLSETTNELKSINLELKTFANVVAHDVKTPLNNILSITSLLKAEYGEQLDNTGNELIEYLNESALNLSDLVNGILDYSRNTSVSHENYETIDLSELIKQITVAIPVPDSFTIRWKIDIESIYGLRVPLIQILMNLITNAIKYNDKEKGELVIEISENAEFFKFRVCDNGPGIASEHHETIFKMLKTLGVLDRNKQKGTGIGLATVKRLIEKLGGEIHVVSENGSGATFEFTIKKVVISLSQNDTIAASNNNNISIK